MTRILPIFLLLILFEMIVCEDGSIESSKSQNVEVKYTSYRDKIVIWIEDKNYTLINVKCTATHSAEGPDTFESRSLLLDYKTLECSDLRPCTKYDVIATMKNNSNNNSFDKTIPVYTSNAEPSIAIKEIKPNALSIQVLWEATNTECIVKYELKAEAEGDTKTNSFTDNTITKHTFETLNPCLNYKISLKMTDKQNQVISKTGSTTTKFKDPGPVENLKISNYTIGNSILVTWKLPAFWTCVYAYHIEWQCDGHDCLPEKRQLKNAKNTEYVIDQIDACSTYIFQIRTNRSQSILKQKFYTGFLTPSNIYEINTLDDSFINTTFSWNKPEKNRRCIKHYNVNIIGPNQLKDKINKTEIIESNIYSIPEYLEPCGFYNISILPVFKTNVIGEIFKGNVSVGEERPGEIEDAIVKYVYPTQFLLKFRNSTRAPLCIKEYRITYWQNDANNTKAATETFPSNQTTFVISDLKSCMAYEVLITPVTYKNDDGAQVQLPVTTPSRVASNPLLEKDAYSTHNSLKLSGSNTDNKNHCEVLFAKFECRSQHNAEIGYAEKIVQADVGISKFSAVMSPLSPNTLYKCSIKLYNIADWSNEVYGEWTTSQYFPGIPFISEAKALSNSSFNIKWEPPKYLNDKLKYYKFYIQSLGPSYKQPSHCKMSKTKILNLDSSKTEYNYTEGLASTLYSAQVAVTNDFGTGKFTTPTIIVTDPSVSDPVDDFTFVSIDGPEIETEKYQANVTLKWLPPCQSNGHIKSYNMDVYGVSAASVPIMYSKEIQNPLKNETGHLYWTEVLHEPEYEYEVVLTITVYNVSARSEGRKTKFIAPAGVPEKIPESEKLGKVDSFLSKNPTNSALVKFSSRIFQSNMGKILYAAVLISEMDCQEEPELKVGKYNIENGWPKLKNWNDVKNESCVSQYQTTPAGWQPHLVIDKEQLRYKNNKDDDDENIIEYIIGNDDCDGQKQFCNGPLKPSTQYKMILRTFTKNGYRDSVAMTFKTDEIVQFYLILLLIVSVLLIAFFIGFIYLWIMKRKSWNRQSSNGIEDSSGDVSLKNFLLHFKKLSAKDKVNREFKEFDVVGQDVSIASTISKYNESKNRYGNIYPYEKNRVILNIDSEGSDYINASFINGYKHRKAYIATQGPKPESVIDFWTMIFEYKVKVIVMVTPFIEDNTIKCHKYFPEIIGTDMRLGNNITILCKSLNKSKNDIYEKRELIVKHIDEEEIQTVIHFMYKSWPDHGVPSDPNDLISFVKIVKAEKIPSRSPIVVHCSAGVGRTGTFIALDLIMQRIKYESKINIYEIVKSLRFQRMKMVQSTDQYQFLYNCTYEIVKKKYEKYANSRTAKLFCIDNSMELLQQDKENSIIKSNENRNGHTESKFKHNSSNISLISNGQIKHIVGGGSVSTSSRGINKNSRLVFNPNDVESVM